MTRLSLTLTIICCAFCFLASVASAQAAPDDQLKEVRVNGIALHYISRGSGPAVVFVHGSVEDYRAWEEQLSPLSDHFQVISYSRRYNFPNYNPLESDKYSAAVDAEDLAALIRTLNVAPAHIVAHSYGAYGALLLAVRHPDLVRSLLLSEPPIHPWLQDLPGGPLLLADFNDNMWKPAGIAFRAGNDDKALQITVDWFGSHQSPTVGGAMNYAALTPEIKKYLRENLVEWHAMTTSRDAFPALARADVAKIKVPVLVMTGDHSLAESQLVAGELARVIPGAQKVTLPGATHEMWSEFPDQCKKIVSEFLAKQH